MDTLVKCRKKIDKIDSKIIKLYEQRMRVVKEVTEYKVSHDLPVLDASREAKMLEKNLKKITNEEFKEYYPDVLNGYLSASKKMQGKIIKK